MAKLIGSINTSMLGWGVKKNVFQNIILKSYLPVILPWEWNVHTSIWTAKSPCISNFHTAQA